MVQRFFASGRTGYHLSVIREGDVGLRLIPPHCPDSNAIPVSDILRLYVATNYTEDEVAACSGPYGRGLAAKLKQHLRERLERIRAWNAVTVNEPQKLDLL